MEKTNGEGSKQRSRSRRHTRAEIEAILARYRASGLAQAEFAGQAGLAPWTLRNWQSQLRHKRSAEPGGGEPSFASVQLRPVRAGTITVRWPHGVVVEIVVPLDETSVVRLVQNLVAPCSR